MSAKSKGINAERELLHAFWGKGFACIRIAGSGSSQYPSADLIAGNPCRKFAIECKVTKQDKKYFKTNEISLFLEFAKRFGAEPWIAVKFGKDGWFFVTAGELSGAGKTVYLSRENALKTCRRIEDLTKDI